MEVRNGLDRSGLPPGEGLGDGTGERLRFRSHGGRGDKGTFHRLASSGKSSSSSSSHSASNSLTDFLLGCHDPLRMGMDGLWVAEEDAGLR